VKKRLVKKKIIRARKIKCPYLCVVEDLPEGYKDKYPFKEGDTVLMMGEVEQMPGHVVIATKDGKVLFGYHAENFRRLTQEEA